MQERKTMVKWYYLALQDGRAENGDKLYPTREAAQKVLDSWPETARMGTCIMSEWREEKISREYF